ncbi:MAG TPA: amino acid-binding protein [Anaeromyxobacteraceae bacterium]|nr:amino acid-binding protein [Anaeromyxobacteraceae bacterium]
MKLRQLSLFLENRPGQLKLPCQILGKAGIDILTMSLADTQQFGILRLIVREDEKAKQALEQAGCVVNVTEVLAAEVPDRAGGLGDVLEAFDRCGISVEYIYPLSAGHRGKTAVLAFRVEDPDRAAQELVRSGVHVLSREEALQAMGA